jgi:hypothetical protein
MSVVDHPKEIIALPYMQAPYKAILMCEAIKMH